MKLSVRDLTVFAMLGAMMFMSMILMMWIPNVHLLALFIAAYTLTYRTRALIPIYVFVLLDGVYQGFSMWWLPRLYVWLPLWAAFMLIAARTAGDADNTSPRLLRSPKPFKYMLICALHGLLFGVMLAPVNALFMGLSFEGAIAWIIAGVPFDIAHAIGNFAAGSMIIPLTTLLKRLESRG